MPRRTDNIVSLYTANAKNILRVDAKAEVSFRYRLRQPNHVRATDAP